ncbi:hypothetical protein [Enterococcus durans]|uniref:hypothetical protein n=1 Tax=Enterococcus durans TaxID=53345 RepID=UPI0011BF071F|nr:hypothetical protein [Enterococcus durans]
MSKPNTKKLELSTVIDYTIKMIRETLSREMKLRLGVTQIPLNEFKLLFCDGPTLAFDLIGCREIFASLL